MNLLFNFSSAKKAYVQPVTGESRGSIPNWIKGTLYRNGPGKFEVGADRYKHTFDGLAMIQRYYINEGKVIFNSQFIQSKAYLQNMAANRIVVSEFGTAAIPDPCRAKFDKVSVTFDKDITDNTLVCVYPVGDVLFTSTETRVINRIDPVDLSTLGSVRLDNVLSIHRATAHFHIEKESAEVHLFGFIALPTPCYALVKLPPIKKEDVSGLKEKYDMEKLLAEARIVGKVNISRRMNPSYIHSFGMTKNYYVFLEIPFVISLEDVIKAKGTGASYSDAFKWLPGEKTIIQVMDRKTGEVLPNTFVTDGLFTYHHANAYEEDGHIVVDYAGYDDANVATDLFIDKATKGSICPITSTARRLVIPLVVNEKDDNLVKLKGTSCTAKLIQGKGTSNYTIYCKQEELCEGVSMELPTINYNPYNGRKYRFIYGVYQCNLIKIDTVTKTSLSWTCEIKESSICESIFVKNPEADDNNPQDEDYGVLLAPILISDENIDTGRFQALIFVDAKTMKELGRVEFPSVSVPYSFHGIYLNDE